MVLTETRPAGPGSDPGGPGAGQVPCLVARLLDIDVPAGTTCRST